MRPGEIESQNGAMIRRQHDFRLAAEVVTEAFSAFDEVQAIAVIGSVAKPLWKEVPRFRAFRKAGIEVWHECGDLDLAVWISSQHRLGELRHARDKSLRDAYERGVGPGVVGHQLDIFLIEPVSDRYLGRLCKFSTCPKDNLDCMVPGCGTVPFNKVVDGFRPHPDLLAAAPYATLYRRGEGRLASALDLPVPGTG